MRIEFDEIVLKNRWRQKKHHRNGTWTIVGIHKHWFGPHEFEYRLCFFGIECHLWFKKVYE